MAKVKPDGHIWALEFKWKKWKKSEKLFKSYRVNKNLWLATAAAYEPVQKHKVTPGIPGWLNYQALV